jgi:hypothetical protein
MPAPLFELPEPDCRLAARQRRIMFDQIVAAPGTFEFIQHSYVWHFNGPVAARTDFMCETWQRVRDNYR